MDNYYERQARGSQDDDLDEYFIDQAGSGISTYEGYRYSSPVNLKGSGFFGRLISSGLMPILRKIMPYVGKKALATVTDIASSIREGKSPMDAIKGSVKKTAAGVVRDAADKIESKLTGKGIKGKSKKSHMMIKEMNPGLRKIFENRANGIKTPKSKKTKNKKAKGKKKQSGRKQRRSSIKGVKSNKKNKTKNKIINLGKPSNHLF